MAAAKFFLGGPICLNSVAQGYFARSHTSSQIWAKSMSFVRKSHIVSPIHISKDLGG